MKKILFILLLSSINLVQASPKVTFVSPDPGDALNTFWKETTIQLLKAARDLGVELEVVYSAPHYTFYRKIVTKIAERPKDKQPDYLLILPMKNSTKEMLDSLSRTKIKVFFINTTLSSQDKNLIGTPRKKYKNWIAHFYPDDAQAASLVAKEVSKNCSDNRDVIAINGTRMSIASQVRQESFESSSKKYNLNLKQAFFGDWKKSKVKKMLPNIEGRYPNTCGFLVASDFMAEAIIESKKKKYHVCSIDWTPDGIENVKNGKQLCSVGGHFLEPSLALVALFDYHNGIDFKNDLGLIYKTSFYTATKSNVSKIYNKLIKSKDFINYRKLSKFYNKNIKKYNFNLIEKL